MRISRWGNSLAVRLPASVVSALELNEGDDIEIVIDQPGRFALHKKPHTQDLFARLRSLRGRLPADFRFSRDEANARR